MIELNADYWDNRYKNKTHRWDIGYPSPAITTYFDNIANRSCKILIPGCGNAYEGEYLYKKGFTNITLLDVSAEAKKLFLKRVPEFKNFLNEDFFTIEGQYDYIIEQTFFCAINPELREKYVEKMHSLLAEGGKLVGLLFNDELYQDHPPYGGFRDEYEKLFRQKFSKVAITPTNLSIKERKGRELFIEIEK